MTYFDFFTQEYIFSQLGLLLRLVLAFLLGIIIGFERKNRNKIAGVRTHAIVAFGAALMMIVSKYGFADIQGSYDASRIASQIVSGVGFLGAGVIFVKDRGSISGLTTAAGIWATAGVGMSVGAGLYIISVFSTLLLVIMQEMLHRIGFLSNENHTAYVRVTIGNDVDILEMERIFRQEKVAIESSKIILSNKESTKIEFRVLYLDDSERICFLQKLITYPGIIDVCE